jgi:hypothetical protein
LSQNHFRPDRNPYKAKLLSYDILDNLQMMIAVNEDKSLGLQQIEVTKHRMFKEAIGG